MHLRFVEEKLTIPFANLQEEGLLDKLENESLKKTLIQLRKKTDFFLEIRLYVYQDEETGDLSIRRTFRNFSEYLPLYKLICDPRK